MAQLFTCLSVILLFAVFNPPVCQSSKMFSERRDRAPYIDSSEHSAQALSVTGGSRLRKGNPHSKEQSSFQAHNAPSTNEQPNRDSTVDKNIRSVFSINSGPGLHLFKNTDTFVNQQHINSYNDHMVGDQPDPHTPPSLPSSSDKEFFKVQRSPDGKLSLVYNEDIVSRGEIDNRNPMANKQNSGSNKENKVQTHFSDGLPLINDKFTTASPATNRTSIKDTSIHFPTEEPLTTKRSGKVDINDCLEDDANKSDKVFCSHLRNYPEKDHLEDLIKKKFPNLETFFGEDFILPQNISQRMNNAPNEEYLCRSRVRVIYPQSGINKEFNWLYIVNSPNYKQGIRIEECLEPGSVCGENTGLSLPNRFTATCEQNYIYRSLIAYANDTIVKDTFRVPSCCKCVLRSHY